MMNYKELCYKAIAITQKCADFLKLEQDRLKESQVESKSLNSLVSYVDQTAEKMLVDQLSELLPDSGFIAEEQTRTNRGELYNWIIDPLDGTTNYIHGLPTYAISIALVENDKIVLGIVYEVGNDECFYAYKDSNAFCNGLEIKVKNNSILANSLVATGFPYYDFSRDLGFYNTLREITQKTRGIRRLGTAATDLAYVACGRFDAFYEHGLSPWDVAAGAFIVERAGGKVCDYSLGDNWLYGKEILASSNELFDNFSDIIVRNFGTENHG